MEEDPTTISDIVSQLQTGVMEQLWLVAGIGILIAGVLWGLPLAIRFFKKLAR